MTVVDGVATAGGPLALRADRPGGRTQRGEGVAWLGLSDGADALIALADRLAASLPADIAARSPRRTPAAHLTLARRADSTLIGALRDGAHGPLGVAWTAHVVQLVRSRLEPDGARYETLHEAPL